MESWLDRTGYARGAVVPLRTVHALALRWYPGRLDEGWRGRTADEANQLLEDVGLTGPFWTL
ncbi:MAG: hypothetical protein RJQ04_13190 [Longimicrobiales bacterium]